MTNSLSSDTAELATRPEIGNELCIVDGLSPEAAFSHPMSGAERLDIAQQLFHSSGYSAGFVPQSIASAGFVPKLCGINPRVNDAIMTAAGGIDIELVKHVLREATKDGGPFSQRSLAKQAGLGPDAVRDILRGENRNPTIATLAPLAQALGKPLSVFGLHFVTQDELRDHIYEALDEMPKRGRDRQARYLAEVVAKLLALPANQPPPHNQ